MGKAVLRGSSGIQAAQAWSLGTSASGYLFQQKAVLSQFLQWQNQHLPDHEVQMVWSDPDRCIFTHTLDAPQRSDSFFGNEYLSELVLHDLIASLHTATHMENRQTDFSFIYLANTNTPYQQLICEVDFLRRDEDRYYLEAYVYNASNQLLGKAHLYVGI